MAGVAGLAMSLVRRLLLAAIRFYKRRVSPHKGYGCAYRVRTGRCSCSTLGYRAISRLGAVRGLGVLRQRLALCHLEAIRHRARRPPVRLAEAGFVDCDVPCDGPCDATGCSEGGCGVIDGVFEAASCGDGCGDGCGRSWARSTRRAGRRRGEPAEPTAWEPGPGESIGKDFRAPPPPE
ncbi:MAG: membrane protein insertion efficiency factor YidD [Betaproteobacteria bacterium]